MINSLIYKTFKLMVIAVVINLFLNQQVFAFAPKETSRYFNGPTVSNVTATSAVFSLSSQVLADLTEEEKSRIYFEYFQTQQVCIAIYPTPQECLPKKTIPGNTTFTIKDLKPGISYTVKYKSDNTIRCFAAPCSSNEFQSLGVEFVTKSESVSPTVQSPVNITMNLFLGMRNSQVVLLQKFLKDFGYFNGKVSGYFGTQTKRAVQSFQKNKNIPATGVVGLRTRTAILEVGNPIKGEYFEGKISAFSTQCFVDGICSVTVGGKVVEVVRGWAGGPVGTLQGVESIGDIEKVIGHTAKVYATKTDEGYTLYGNNDFYIRVE